MYGGFSLSTSRVSYHSTQFWHYLPGNGIRSHRLRTQSNKTTPCERAISNPDHHPSSWLTCYRSEIPMTASWVWWGLTELRITPHILDCWFIIKDYNLGRVRWKRQARQSRWGEASASMAPATHPTSPSVAMQELSEPHSFGFSWRPHYISTIKS